MNERAKPYPIGDKEWNGEAFHCAGSEYRLEDGTIQIAKRYDCWFGGAETVTVNGVEILGRCEIKVDDILFILRNLYHPVIQISSVVKNIHFMSDHDAPAMIGKIIEKAMDKEPFRSHVGQLFLNRVPEVLNYSFDACPRPLTLEELKNIPAGTLLWYDMIELETKEAPVYFPLSPVEFCGLGLETFEDTSVPVPVIYFSDGLDYQDTYGEDIVLWTAKPAPLCRSLWWENRRADGDKE
jgi:hypothetical protein